jgi:hypothetical protein
MSEVAFQMDTVQLEPQVALVLDPTPPVMPPELYGPLRSIASDDGLCPLAVIRALAACTFKTRALTDFALFNHLIRAGAAVAGYADLEVADFPAKLAPEYMGAD